MRKTDAEEVLARLAPARRALGLARLRRWTQRGLAAGAALAAFILAVAHVWSFGLVLPLSIAVLLLGLLGGVFMGLWLWPNSAQAARIVDHHFAFDDRITTALQFRSSSAPLALLQRADVARRVRPLALKQSRRGQVAWRESMMMTAALLGFIGLLFLGGIPTSAVSASATAASIDQTRIRRVALVSVPAITRTLQHDPLMAPHSNPALAELDFQLALLRHQLLQAQTRSAALRSISLTQLRLRQLAGTLHPVDSRTIRQLNQALGPYARQQPGGSRSPGAGPAATAQSLRRLADSFGALTAAERDRLARVLARAANMIGEPHLRSYLHQAASSLAYDDPPTASRALQKAASFLASTPNARIEARNLKAANQQLEQLKISLYGASAPGAQHSGSAGGHNPRGNSNSSASRSNIGKSRSRSAQATQSSARGSGVSGSARFRRNSGPGREVAGSNSGGAANGRVTGTTSRKGGEGGIFYDVPSPQQGHRANSRGSTIYVPGVQGRGPHAVQLGSSGTPQFGRLVPYRQVIVQYTRSAQTALDRAALPPGLQSYVHRYFDQLAR